VGDSSNSLGQEGRQHPSRATKRPEFLGLPENPFNINPDPRYLFLTAQIRVALDTLIRGIRRHSGLILLTGEVGTGKTTLIHCLIDWLHREKMPTAFVSYPHLDAPDLLNLILAEFGEPFGRRRSGSALTHLNEWLLDRHFAHESPVLIVDEAQGLSYASLREIGSLLDLKTGPERLLQIVLVGQLELEGKLKREELRDLRQKVALHCKTAPLTLEETRAYIQARLQTAGSSGKPMFTSGAVDALHFYARGIPREINLLGEHALLNAHLNNLDPVPVEVVDKVAREFQFEDAEPHPPSRAFKDVGGAQSVSVTSTPPNSSAPPLSVTMPRSGAPLSRSNCDSIPMILPGSSTFVNREGDQALRAQEDLSHDIRAPGGRSVAIKSRPWKAVDRVKLTSENAFELLCELAPKFRSIASAPRFHLVESKMDLYPSVTSQHSPGVTSKKIAPGSIPKHIRGQSYLDSLVARGWKMWGWLMRGSDSWKPHQYSAAVLRRQTDEIRAFWRGAKQLMSSRTSIDRRSLAWWDGSWSLIRSISLPRKSVLLLRWLQQPWHKSL
jgi:general secretion pathway protein A